ncbi:MAG: universal stress protein [Terracidiphilus sp.]
MNGNKIARWISPDLILVATNLLEGQTFLLHAIHQARLSKSKLLLVHVITPSGLRTETLDGAPSPALNRAVKAVQMKLDEIVEEFQFEGILCEPIVLTGDPAKQIALIAKSRAVDRVILAARYEPRVARMIEASVAEEVIATIDVPVCIIGRRVLPCPARDAPLGRVLCATSFHSGSLQVVRFASSLAVLNHAHLTLLHVLESEGMGEQRVQMARFAARERLCASVPAEARQRDHPNFLIKEGDPALIILAEALSLSQDLVILGSHHIQMASRLLTNRVVRQVIDESQCPVITINSDPVSSAREIHELTSPETMSLHS